MVGVWVTLLRLLLEGVLRVTGFLSDPPKITFRTDGAGVIAEVASLVPANYTWMTCSSANNRFVCHRDSEGRYPPPQASSQGPSFLSPSGCGSNSSWTEVPDTSGTDSDVSCEKKLQSSFNRPWEEEHHFRFCLTNSVGSWCETLQVLQPQPVQAAASRKTRFLYERGNGQKKIAVVPSRRCSFSRRQPKPAEMRQLAPACGSGRSEHGPLLLCQEEGDDSRPPACPPVHANTQEMMLKLWVPPQKPKYQPQLQMIQMVGPNDNDYIYINFKDFEYDTKWEFPRENLELGMNHTRPVLSVKISTIISRK